MTAPRADLRGKCQAWLAESWPLDLPAPLVDKLAAFAESLVREEQEACAGLLDSEDALRNFRAAEAAIKERDAARRFGEDAATKYNALLAEGKILRCAFCDAEYPAGTPPTQHEALTAHVMVCERHPLKAERDAALAQAKEAETCLTYERQRLLGADMALDAERAQVRGLREALDRVAEKIGEALNGTHVLSALHTGILDLLNGYESAYSKALVAAPKTEEHPNNCLCDSCVCGGCGNRKHEGKCDDQS